MLIWDEIVEFKVESSDGEGSPKQNRSETAIFAVSRGARS